MYRKKLHLHFMGIGGIGMSGIAEIVQLQGYTVSGCDANTKGKIIPHLQSIGCTVSEGHAASHIDEADVLIYSSAVDQNHPEVQAALEKGIPAIPRAIMLAELMRTKYSIAVAGSHGKTTTTSLLSHITMECNKKPTVIVGGILKSISSTATLGKGDLLIAEADESDRSLLYLNPSMAIVTNIDAEHLDTYKDIGDIKETFKNFLGRLPFYGKAFVCIDDEHVRSILPLPHVSTIKYGFSTKADVMADIIDLDKAQSTFDVYSNRLKGKMLSGKKKLGRVTLNMPGEHNVANALATIAVCLELDVPFKKIATALSSFKGVERRFEHKGNFRGAEIFDDYGHHPTEIQKTLTIAQRRKDKNLFVAFQPHRYTRTEKLWDEFVNIFSSNNNYHINKLYITEIYPASEQPIPNISTETLINAIKLKNPTLDIHHAPTYETIVEDISSKLTDGDLFITVGAGKVNQVGEALLVQEKEQKEALR